MIARTKDTMIGYVTYSHPDPLERWSEFNMENIMVLGAIEISSHPANRLMVGIGNLVPAASIKQFNRLRFLRRYQRKIPKEQMY